MNIALLPQSDWLGPLGYEGAFGITEAQGETVPQGYTVYQGDTGTQGETGSTLYFNRLDDTPRTFSFLQGIFTCPVHGPVSDTISFHMDGKDESLCLRCIRDLFKKFIAPLEEGGGFSHHNVKPAVVLSRYDLIRRADPTIDYFYNADV